MLKVKNKKVIRTLAYRNLKANKKKNIIAVIAIMLTTLLFTSLFTIGEGIVSTIQMTTIRQSGGDGHAVLKYLSEEEYNTLKANDLIKEISYNQIIADSVDNPEFLKRHVEMYYMDDTAMKLGFFNLVEGKKPEAENEMVTDTLTLDLLGIPHQVGQMVSLTYTAKGKQYQKDFMLSGYWESDELLNVGFVVVSKAFTQKYADEMHYTYREDGNMVGGINSYIMFKNSSHLWEKIAQVVESKGYKINDNQELLPNEIEANVNWAYLSAGVGYSPELIAGGVVGILLITFAGYLIIYNIFHISVLNDIRFFGLLKTIGTTPRQIKAIIRFKGLVLSLIALPIGMVLGCVIGKVLVPIIMEFTGFGQADLHLRPSVFICSAWFALITVLISIRKPGKVAAQYSAIEAMRYSEKPLRRKSKKTTDGGKLYRMAFSNLSRNKKRTVLSVLSMTFSLVLFLCVCTISSGLDMDKLVGRFIKTDFIIAHANYFNSNNYRFAEDELSKDFIEAVKSQQGFKSGGSIYKNSETLSTIYRENPNEPSKYQIGLAENGMPYLALYGMEDFCISNLEVVEGSIDFNKLKTGEYIIQSLGVDDYNEVEEDVTKYKIGDKVKIEVGGIQKEYTLIAKVKSNSSTYTDGFASSYIMILPAEAYKSLYDVPLIMNYSFNVEPEMNAEMENFVERYTQNEEMTMDYKSKLSYGKEFEKLKNMVIIVGGALSFIIGLIGILNFINSTITSILARKNEFAVLESIGMTRKQLKNMLQMEGLYYAFLTIGASFIVGMLASKVIVEGIVGRLWFFSYHFEILPLVYVYPVLIIIGLLMPIAAYCGVSRLSIVERLREIE